jgi:hypothetical protein
MGLLRQLQLLQQTCRVLPHPREGGSSRYPVWFREEQLEKWYAGEATASQMPLMDLKNLQFSLEDRDRSGINLVDQRLT